MEMNVTREPNFIMIIEQTLFFFQESREPVSEGAEAAPEPFYDDVPADKPP